MRLYEIFNYRIGWYRGTEEQADNIVVFDSIHKARKAYSDVYKKQMAYFRFCDHTNRYEPWMDKEKVAMELCMTAKTSELEEWENHKKIEVAV